MTERQSTATGVKFAPNAEVDLRATIGRGTTIWGLACIREDAVLGRDCIVGRGVYIEDDVILGDRVKVQTNALLFKPARISNDVFIGPAVVLTNDRYPARALPTASSSGTRTGQPRGWSSTTAPRSGRAR